MANQSYIGVSGTTQYRKATGEGTDNDPFISEFHDPDIGNKSDSAATTDIGPFSLIALFKRSLQWWSSFLVTLGTRVEPASINGSLMARLLYIANNLNGEGGGGNATYSSEITEVTDAAVINVYPSNGQLIVDTADWRYLSLWIQNTGATAISGIKTEGAPTGLEFKYKFIAETSDNYTSESGKNGNNQLIHVIESSGLPAIAASGEGWVQLWVATLDKVRISIKTDSDSTTAQINGTLMR